jgi:hypothetical protein
LKTAEAKTLSGRFLSVVLWIAALAVTVMLAYFQRMTGPSYPLRGSAVLGDGQEVQFRLPRSDQGRGALRVKLPAVGEDTTATLQWRRYPTNESYRDLPMKPSGTDGIEATIPKQPAAGKVEYRIVTETRGELVVLPPDETVVARYRGDVPAGVLIPHILAMFIGMLVSTRALLEVIRPAGSAARVPVVVAMGLLMVGGLILGPVVQKFAFGAFWTGWPFGHDLTDNKTLIAVLAWLPATIAAIRGWKTRVAVVMGWLVMMGIFLIPHSMRGSQLDWSTIEGGGESVARLELPAR